MSDCTYLYANVHPEDWNELIEVSPLFRGLPTREEIFSEGHNLFDINPLPTGEIEVHLTDVNYGGFEDLNACANQGWRFYGYHGTGSCYGPLAFACAGEAFHYASSDWEGNVVVAAHLHADEVTTDAAEVLEARHVLRAEKEVREQCQQWQAMHEAS